MLFGSNSPAKKHKDKAGSETRGKNHGCTIQNRTQAGKLLATTKFTAYANRPDVAGAGASFVAYQLCLSGSTHTCCLGTDSSSLSDKGGKNGFWSQMRCWFISNRIDMEHALNELTGLIRESLPKTQTATSSLGAGMSERVEDKAQAGAPIWATGSMLGAIGGCFVGLILAVPGVAPVLAVGTSGNGSSCSLVGAGIA